VAIKKGDSILFILFIMSEKMGTPGKILFSRSGETLILSENLA
jgi:hypothetical protein